LFATQSFLLIKAAIVPGLAHFRISAISAAVYGVLTEVMQGWLTTSRNFDYFDMLADFAGCLLVYIWFTQIRK
jgi:VanZ family protein